MERGWSQLDRQTGMVSTLQYLLRGPCLGTLASIIEFESIWRAIDFDKSASITVAREESERPS